MASIDISQGHTKDQQMYHKVSYITKYQRMQIKISRWHVLTPVSWLSAQRLAPCLACTEGAEDLNSRYQG